MPLTPPVAPCHGDRCFYAATITAAATTLFLLGVIAAAAASVPTYWSAREANTAFLRTAWASTHHASAAACVGRGGHIHSATGTPLYRYFICLVTVPGKLPDALKWVWLRAANPAATSAGRPDDLADNPLAPTPPSRFRRQYWNAEQALTALARTSFARTRKLSRDRGHCHGVGYHYHLVGETVYRSFACGMIGADPPPPKHGQLPKLPPLVTAWLSVHRDGTFTTGLRRPLRLWATS